jgi:hypothetical protein
MQIKGGTRQQAIKNTARKAQSMEWHGMESRTDRKLGHDVSRRLARAQRSAHACAETQQPQQAEGAIRESEAAEKECTQATQSKQAMPRNAARDSSKSEQEEQGKERARTVAEHGLERDGNEAGNVLFHGQARGAVLDHELVGGARVRETLHQNLGL